MIRDLAEMTRLVRFAPLTTRAICARSCGCFDALPNSSCRSIPGTQRRSFSGVGFRGGLDDFPAVVTHRPFEAIADAEHADTEDVEAWFVTNISSPLAMRPTKTPAVVEENWLGSRPSLTGGTRGARHIQSGTLDLPGQYISRYVANISLVIGRPSCSLAAGAQLFGLGFVRRPALNSGPCSSCRAFPRHRSEC